MFRFKEGTFSPHTANGISTEIQYRKDWINGAISAPAIPILKADDLNRFLIDAADAANAFECRYLREVSNVVEAMRDRLTLWSGKSQNGTLGSVLKTAAGLVKGAAWWARAG